MKKPVNQKITECRPPGKSQRNYLFILPVAIILTGLCGCGTGEQKDDAEEEDTQDEGKGVVEIVTNALDIVMPAEIPSGWTTFRYINKSQMTHFLVLEKMPVHDGEQKTVEDSKEEVVPVFQTIMDSLIVGGEPPYGELPEWFGDVAYVGGTGLIGPGKTSVTTLKVDPGTYVVECYVKNPGGYFHSSQGMITGLEVTEESTDAAPPEPTLEITMSSESGIGVQDEIQPGRHTVAVHFEDQKVQEHFAGFDIHLARLRDTTTLEFLGKWMNWMEPKGLQILAPVEFLGGSQEMPAGSTAYFTLELTAGRYAWISEVPDPAAKNMLKVFEVGD